MNILIRIVVIIAAVSFGLLFVCSCADISDAAHAASMPLPSFSVVDANGKALTEKMWQRGAFILHSKDDSSGDSAVISAITLIKELQPAIHFQPVIISTDGIDADASPGWHTIHSPELLEVLRGSFGDFAVLVVQDGVVRRRFPAGYADIGQLCAGIHVALSPPEHTILHHLNQYPPHELLPLEDYIEAGAQRWICINNIGQLYKQQSILSYLDGLHAESGVSERVLLGPRIPAHEAASILGNFDLPSGSQRVEGEFLQAWKELDRKQYLIGVNFVIEKHADGEMETVFLDDTTIWQLMRGGAEPAHQQ